jgi:predicted kinase
MTALADAVASRLGFTVLSSDRIRKELAGLPAEASARAPFGMGIYSAEWDRTRLRRAAAPPRRAALLLAHGEPVIADASFSCARHRAAAAATAAEASADLMQLRCTASPELAARRMAILRGKTPCPQRTVGPLGRRSPGCRGRLRRC